MTLSDFPLLGKKIVVGIIVALIPIAILLGGVWFTQKVLKTDKADNASSIIQKK